jgi:hypothetical protein
MSLFLSVTNHLTELVNLLEQLEDSHYQSPSKALSNSTIGQHTRHIIELFQCLLLHYEEGTVCYDKRNRNKRIEQDRFFAIENIQNILQNMELENKEMLLSQCIAGMETTIETNYFRELLYNMEHCIHHQALIKVGILDLENISISEGFGVAESTINSKQLAVNS